MRDRIAGDDQRDQDDGHAERRREERPGEIDRTRAKAPEEEHAEDGKPAQAEDASHVGAVYHRPGKRLLQREPLFAAGEPGKLSYHEAGGALVAAPPIAARDLRDVEVA